MMFRIGGIEETPFYQAILRESFGRGYARGCVEEARTILLHQGREKFGPPDLQDEARIVALDDRDRLRDLILRVLDVASWEELLADSPNGSG